jgi:streptogrisin D
MRRQEALQPAIAMIQNALAINDSGLLCQSGATSGTVCNMQTQSGTYSSYGCDSDGDCYYMHGMAKAVKLDGGVIGQGGDSGAPVFSLNGSGVTAKGVLSGRQTTNYAVMLYQDMDDTTANLWYPRTP